jgi:hypothetical protein
MEIKEGWIQIPNSSNLSAIKVVPNPHDTNVTLHVEFSTGHHYSYTEVSEKHIQKMIDHASPGQYFRDHIRGWHDFKQHR